MLYAAALVAAPREDQDPSVSACCNDTSECGSQVCCDAQSINMSACSPEAAGYCQTSCRPH